MIVGYRQAPIFIPAELPDDFDLLLSGVIDSFGILEMISSIEEEFQIELDVAALDAEQITIVGPLSSIRGEQCEKQVIGKRMYIGGTAT